MTEPLITTVIPTYRRPNLLKRAVESVLSQTYKNLIVCIYDNSSDDRTEQVVKSISKQDSRVRYFKNKSNIGALANMVQGINRVNTPYYSLLNDDDFLLPNFYEQAIKGFKKFPSAEFVCSKTIVIDLIRKKLQFRNTDWNPGFYQPSCEIITKMYNSHFVTTGVLVSKRLTERIGSFDESGSDLIYVTVASASANFVVLPIYGSAFTIHENSYSTMGDGIVKESIRWLYDRLVKSIRHIILLNIPDDKKVQLLMYVLKLYQEFFDTKKLNFAMTRNYEDDLNDLIGLPSLLTNRGLIAKAYKILPEKTHFFLSCLVRALRVSKKALNEKFDRTWLILPEQAYTSLNSKKYNLKDLFRMLLDVEKNQIH